MPTDIDEATLRDIEIGVREGWAHSRIPELVAAYRAQAAEIARLREDLSKAHSLITDLAKPDFTVARQAAEIAAAAQTIRSERDAALAVVRELVAALREECPACADEWLDSADVRSYSGRTCEAHRALLSRAALLDPARTGQEGEE